MLEHGQSGSVRQTAPSRLSWWRWSRYVGLVLCLVGSGPLAGGTGAAERSRPFRIGALTASWGPTPMIVGLRDGLVALGYREDQDFVLGVRFTQGDTAVLPEAARQLVQYEVDLIFTSENAPAKAAQQATSKIPIVFTSVGDPVGLGLVQSFARPGGNITGVTDLELTLAPKRLQIFQEMLPHLKRVLFVYNADIAYEVRLARVYGEAARDLGIELTTKGVRTQDEARTILADIRHGAVDGLLSAIASLNIPGFIQEAETREAIPAMHNSSFFVERGGLASYAPNVYEEGKQAARLVDKILKGAKPAEIPVEVNSKIELPSISRPPKPWA